MPTTPLHRIRTNWSGIAGSPFVTTMMFDASVATPQEQADDVLAFWDGLQSHIQQDLSYTIDTVIDVVDPVTGNTTGVESVTSTLNAGLSASDPLPLGTQAYGITNTGVWQGSRQMRGRVYVPGCTETDSVQGGIESTFVDAILNGITGLSVGAGLCVYSPTYSVWHPIISTSRPTGWARLTTRKR